MRHLIHAVNLMLELLGECTFFDEARAQVIDAPIKRLNWQILPKGERPYAVLRERLELALKHVKEGNRNFIETGARQWLQAGLHRHRPWRFHRLRRVCVPGQRAVPS